MLKKILVTLLIMSSIATMGAYCLYKWGPLYFYCNIMINGAKNNYLNLKKPYLGHLGGFSYTEINSENIQENNVFKKMIFGHFEVVLPIRHPAIRFIPIIRKEVDDSHQPLLGLTLVNPKYDSKEISFEIQKTERISLNFYTEKLFTYPFIKKYILGKSTFEIWRDIYRKDLLFGINRDLYQNPFLLMKAVIKKSDKNYLVEDLIYNLYILFLRQKIFQNYQGGFSWYDRGNFGILDFSDDHQIFSSEKLVFKNADQIYSVILKTKKESSFAKKFRNMLLETMRLSLSDEDYSRKMYDEFRHLPYEEKIGQEGLIYLFVGWSHARDNENYLREMIEFAEKGKNNFVAVMPLYEYAYAKYETNFSKINHLRKETSKVFMERKIDEHNQQEILKINEGVPEEKSTEEERVGKDNNSMDGILKKIKEKKVLRKNSQNLEVD